MAVPLNVKLSGRTDRFSSEWEISFSSESENGGYPLLVETKGSVSLDWSELAQLIRILQALQPLLDEGAT